MEVQSRSLAFRAVAFIRFVFSVFTANEKMEMIWHIFAQIFFLIFKINKNEDTAQCHLICNLNFFATAYRLIRKNFKSARWSTPPEPERFFGRKEVLPSPIPNIAEDLPEYESEEAWWLGTCIRYRTYISGISTSIDWYNFEVHQKYNYVHFKRGWVGWNVFSMS